MKVAIYQPFNNQLSVTGMNDMIHAINKDVIVEMIYDFDELLSNVKKGDYSMVFARRPEHYMKNVIEYYELMDCATRTSTKIYETSSFIELTATFQLEARKPFNELQMQTIYSFINKKVNE